MNDCPDSAIRALLARLDDETPLPPPFETLLDRSNTTSPNRKIVLVATGGLVAAGIVGVALLPSNESRNPASNAVPTATSTTGVVPPNVTVTPTIAISPDDRSYRIVTAHLSVSASTATLNVGSEHGLRPGVGVYQGRLIGIVEETSATTSTARLLGSAGLEVPAAVPYLDADAEDQSGVSTIEGTVRALRDQVVFTPVEPISDDGLIVGEDVVVAGGPDTLLHGKVAIGSISHAVSIDGSTSYMLQLRRVDPDTAVTIIVPK